MSVSRVTAKAVNAMPLSPLRPFLAPFLSQCRHPLRQPIQTITATRNVSHKTRKRQALKLQRNEDPGKQIPHDLGLFDGTFIMPSKPSWLASPRVRYRLYRHRLWKIWENFRLMLSWRYGTSIKPRPSFEYFKIRKAAKLLHKTMFEAIADRDKAALERICGEGLYKDLCTKIDNQDHLYRGTPLDKRPTYTISHQTRYPRILSSRAMIIPGIDSSAMRQHVVRIKSRQTVSRPPAAGEGEGKWTTEKKSVVDYVVVQKRFLVGKEGKWMIWGTVKPSTAEETLGKLADGKKVKAPLIAVA